LLGGFLLGAYKRQTHELHEIWLSVVESYARRNLTQPSDKFKAISGVAMRYWDGSDRYLAGLWQDTFAEEVIWKLEAAKSKARPSTPADPNAPKPEYIDVPLWSWASLPANSTLRFKPNFVKAKEFEFVRVLDFDLASVSNDDAIEVGSTVQRVAVKGRMRPFWTSSFTFVPWGQVSLTKISSGEGVDHEEISFSAYQGEDVYSVSLESGRLAVSEKRTEEIVAQLDYIEDAALVAEGGLEVECLEVGVGSMLLVCRDGNSTAYHRLGACHEVRPNFFNGQPTREIVLG
jgi:hypothetical protein